MSKLVSTCNLLSCLWPIIRCSISCMAGESCSHNFYQVKPLKLGVEVFGIDLKEDVPEEVITQIKKDVTKYRLVVFRDQGIISGDGHVEITRWFGEPESTFYRHPQSPHLDVFRVSNDRQEGCTGVGRTGWHIDGSFQPAPFSYALYHIWSVPKQGDTVFVPLTEIIEGLSLERYNHWDRLWMVSDARADRFHPLIYSHPLTGKKVLCFHLGMTEAFVWDYGTISERMTDARETRSILNEIHEEIMKNNGAMQYAHKWRAGDFIMSDNLALGHEASPETQLPQKVVGLRVMHRTTVAGIRPPQKEWLHQESGQKDNQVLSDEL